VFIGGIMSDNQQNAASDQKKMEENMAAIAEAVGNAYRHLEAVLQMAEHRMVNVRGGSNPTLAEFIQIGRAQYNALIATTQAQAVTDSQLFQAFGRGDHIINAIARVLINKSVMTEEDIKQEGKKIVDEMIAAKKQAEQPSATNTEAVATPVDIPAATNDPINKGGKLIQFPGK
jgi:hypothetical protein